MELMCVRVLVFFFFPLWRSFSSSAGLDSHLNFRSSEEPPGEDGCGRGRSGRGELGVGGGEEEGRAPSCSWVFAPAVPRPQPLPLL